MKFQKTDRSAWRSECGRYEIRASYLVNGKPFYNAWRMADDKHIEASFERSVVREACEADATRQAQPVLPAVAS